MWITLVSDHFIANILYFFLFWMQVFATLMILVFLCNSGQEHDKRWKKRMPCVFLIMVVGTSMILFVAIFETIAHGMTHGGILTAFLISVVFEFIWLHVYCVSLKVSQ